MKEEIHIDDWERKEHFNLFLHSDLPFYNVNFNINVDGLKEFCKENIISVTNALAYVSINSLRKIDNFLYRMENGKVVKYHKIDPSIAYIRNNENLFRMINIDFIDDIKLFDERAKNAVTESNSYFNYSILRERTNFVFISPLPWIPFTGVDHTLSLQKQDAIPRISWGKIHHNGSNLVLPYNIQVNHAFVDGLHIGLFYESLCKEIFDLIG